MIIYIVKIITFIFKRSLLHIPYVKNKYKKHIAKKLVARQKKLVAWQIAFDEDMKQLCARCYHPKDSHRSWGYGYCLDCNVYTDNSVCSAFVTEQDYDDDMKLEWLIQKAQIHIEFESLIPWRRSIW